MKTIPVARGGLPLLGHAIPLLRDPPAFLADVATQADLVRLRLGVGSAVLVCSPDLTDRVFRDDRTFDKGGAFIDRARDVVGNGLSNCPHHMHRRQRRLLQPAFQPVRLPAYAETMTVEIDRVLKSWRDGAVVDVNEQMSRLTMNVLTATMFSDTLPQTAVREAYEDAETIVSGIIRRMLVPAALTRLPLLGNGSFDRAVARMRRTVTTLVAHRRDSDERADLLGAVLAAHDPETGDALSDDEIANEVLTFLMAGTETTATALSWALHLLAEHPEIESRLHDEVDTVLSGRSAAQADLPRLELTGRVITETLRLRSPGWLFTRIVTTDTVLGGHPLAAGTTVVYSPLLVHHRPEVYPEPTRFDPDRWLDPTIPRTAFIPFAGGARRCIGDKFALVEATLALATIASRWRLAGLPGARVRPAMAVVLRPKRLLMRTIRRA
ncbi:cytochrome P450 [Actinokineospora enzanensis]|uniref:cytochrome P450 n=1 Tax=Actinokineospora enzanensis TaxID=155975 RepID=UPI0003A15D15|nr:cytochrome P450 [Actinokineospora enzanensis]